MDASWDDEVSPIPFLGHCDLDLVSRIGIESLAYLLYSLRYHFGDTDLDLFLE